MIDLQKMGEGDSATVKMRMVMLEEQFMNDPQFDLDEEEEQEKNPDAPQTTRSGI